MCRAIGSRSWRAAPSKRSEVRSDTSSPPETEESAMTAVVAFDVNETLLDLRALDPAFEQLLGSSALRAQWFAQMLQLSFVGGLTGSYVDFSTAQSAALKMVAERVGRPVSDAEVDQMVLRMR